MFMHRLAGLVVVLGLASSATLAAQDSTGAPASRRAPAQGSWRAPGMRQQVEERFARRVKEELGLSEEQAAKLRTVAGSWYGKRRALEADQRLIRQALAGQLRPGIAADADSVSRLIQRLLDLRVAYAETYRDENEELDFLTPVQRAQYHVLRERLVDALAEARRERQEQGRRRAN